MPRCLSPSVTPDEIDLAISELETRLERLRALYEQYFMGIERIEPQVVRKDVDRRFWLLRKEKIRNTAKRFKLQTLVQRYNTLQQYWGRICREIEQGTYKRHKLRAERAFGPLDAARASASSAEAAPPPDARAEAAERAQRALEQDLRLLADNPNDLDAALESFVGGSSSSAADSGPQGTAESLASPRKGGLLAQLGTSGARPATSPSPRSAALSSPSPQAAGSLPSRVPGSPKVELPKAAGARDPASRPPPPVPRPSPSVRPAPPSGAAPSSASTASPPGASVPRVSSPGASAASPPGPLSPRSSSADVPPTSQRPPLPRTAAPTPPPGPPSSPAHAAAPTQAAATSGSPPVRPRSVPPRPAPGAQARARSAPPPPKAPPASGLDEARLRELHQRYQAAREQTKMAGAVSLEKLAQNLRETEAKLRAQHQGRRVDFDVVIKDGKPVIRPKVT